MVQAIIPGPCLPHPVDNIANRPTIHTTALSLAFLPVQLDAAALLTQDFDSDNDDDGNCPMSEMLNLDDSDITDSSTDPITNEEVNIGAQLPACLLILLQLAELLLIHTVAKKSAKDPEHPAPHAAAAAAAMKDFEESNPAQHRCKCKATDVTDNGQGASNRAKCHQLDMRVPDHSPSHHVTSETVVNSDDILACTVQLSSKHIESAFNTVRFDLPFITNTNSILYLQLLPGSGK